MYVLLVLTGVDVVIPALVGYDISYNYYKP